MPTYRARLFRLLALTTVSAVMLGSPLVEQPVAQPVAQPIDAAPASHVAGATRQLGTFRLIGAADCGGLPGYSCVQFSVDACPTLTASRTGFLARKSPSRAARGLVVFFAGGPGTSYWGDTPEAMAFTDGLVAQGLEVVQVRWQASWLAADTGELDAGPGHTACRPATVLKHLHDVGMPGQTYLPAAASPAQGTCGFCAVGSSGGSSAVSYALSFYGLDGEVALLDAVFPVSGPPHAALARGCSTDPRDAEHSYDGPNMKWIDRPYGFADGTGPCALKDQSFRPRWDAESVETGGARYVHPQTRVHFVFSTTDAAVNHGIEYALRLQRDGSPYVGVDWVENMPHAVTQSPDGLSRLEAAVLSAAATAACANGLDDDRDGTADAGGDPGCADAADPSELDPAGPTCDNGLDDDADGQTDARKDPECASPLDDEGTGPVEPMPTGPSVSVVDAGPVTEGADGTSTLARFNVELSEPMTSNVSVDFQTVDGTAAATSGDYESLSGRVGFRAGTTSRQVAVHVLGDGESEPDETFSLTLTSPSGVAIGAGQAAATIVDDDGGSGGSPGAPGISLAVSDPRAVAEGDTDTRSRTRFVVRLDQVSSETVSVGFATTDASGRAGSDYVATQGTVTFRPGETSKTVAVRVVGDHLPEPREEFVLVLSQPSGASVTSASAVAAIIDDDTAR